VVTIIGCSMSISADNGAADLAIDYADIAHSRFCRGSGCDGSATGARRTTRDAQTTSAVSGTVWPTHPRPVPHSSITDFYSSKMKTTRYLSTAALIMILGAALAQAAPVAENWENHCTKCHGEDGKGQTKAGKKLQVKDYTDAKVQAAMSDEEIVKAITDGVFDKAGKEKMKAYKDELSAAEIKELLAYTRKFKG